MLYLQPLYKRILTGVLLLGIGSVIWMGNSKSDKERNTLDRAVVYLFSPVIRAGRWVGEKTDKTTQRYLWHVGLADELNEALFTVQALRTENNQLRNYKLENQRLRRILKLQDQTRSHSVAAQVVAVDSTRFARTLFVNRGTRDGVQQRMPVVTAEGVVGRVVKATARLSEIRLITDLNSNVAVRLRRSRAQGILGGDNSYTCSLNYVPRSEEVRVGDVVVTSGLAEIFPPGLVIGKVSAVKNTRDTVTQSIRVAPAVNFAALPEEVLIVTGYQGRHGATSELGPEGLDP